ncbi:MAG: ABC transporter permease [Erysipelothrix sp.]|nr:ABC transporter permease [Erysipelothrix sp.]
MKHLINFSLSRRFRNKVTVILHLLIVTLLFCFVFSDKIIEKLFINSQDLTNIYYDSSVSEYINYFNEDNELFRFKAGYKDKEINLKNVDGWIIESEFALDPMTSSHIHVLIEDAIINKWLNEMSFESSNMVLDNIYPDIKEVTLSKVGVSVDKQNISMFLITGIYFAMLSFSTMIANEVVYEKTSRVLELVLTSVDTSTHYLSKMIIGWLTILIQILMVGFEVGLAILIRNYYDQGLGLIKMLQKYGLIQVKANTFKEFLTALDINTNLLSVLLISLLYLMIGMVIIQTIMVCISSFINSVEESSGIQAPVYIILLIVYYTALALNSPSKLNEGLGYYFSLTPVFSMLFMPMRLLLLDVSFYEVGLGIIVSLITLSLTTYYGAYIYNIGILGGLNMKKKKIGDKK